MKNIIVIESAHAIGQSRFVKNSFQSTLPNVIASGPPSNSGMTNSPLDVAKTKIDPATIPDFDNGMVIVQNAFVGRHPRS